MTRPRRRGTIAAEALRMSIRVALLAAAIALSLVARGFAQAPDWIWVEGEDAARADVTRHPWWYEKVKPDALSGGRCVAHFDEAKPGTASYRVEAKRAGDYTLWLRANPTRNELSVRVNGGEWSTIGANADVLDTENIAADGKVDLRFVAWINAGRVTLKQGANAVEFRFGKSDVPQFHGLLDCFVLTADPAFRPRGLAKPDPFAAGGNAAKADDAEWFTFDPPADPFTPNAGFDLRSLNEPFAGEGGRIVARGEELVHEKTGRPVRFWGVNGPGPEQARTYDDARKIARALAKRGVNLVRWHGAVFDEKTGELRPERLAQLSVIVDAMCDEGIYTHLSIYFPLWLKPGPGVPFLRGYDGNTHPFAALFFNPDFEAQYRGWWRAVMAYKSPRTGRTLAQEPAVFGVEIVNEDSFFFWTFDPARIPDAQLRLLEKQFGDWLTTRHGSIDKALAAWGSQRVARDAPADGRVSFRPLWNIANERTPRDRDTARFLAEAQRGFYDRTIRYLRELGFAGLVTTSNWTTASATYLTPIEKWTYTVGDVIDRHGYFDCALKGDNAEWSVRAGHTYRDRSALRFDAEQANKPAEFGHPANDPAWGGKPSIISETTFNRPNRYRGEAPLFYAVYGSLQGGDAIVHFALDSAGWSVKPNFWMQPWTLWTPTQMGQFPAAALIYRQGLVGADDVVADLSVRVDDLLNLKGIALAQQAALDQLRAADRRSPAETADAKADAKADGTLDPLLFYVGRTRVNFVDGPAKSTLADVAKRIDRAARTVMSANGQVKLDWGRGVLTVDAPAAQVIAGNVMAAGGRVRTGALDVESGSDNLHVVLVPLDGKPVASSAKLLLQVMTEERPTGWRTESAGDATRIVSLGTNPWQVRKPSGTVRLLRPDAKALRVTRLDANGYRAGDAGTAAGLKLAPDAIYYLVEAAGR
jgi:hypothetical protein